MTDQEAIAAECDELKAFLLAKNAKYGSSALQPRRIFSKANSIEQILVRIDDKVNRIATSGEQGPDEDTVLDLIGYLVLLRVARKPKPVDISCAECGHSLADYHFGAHCYAFVGKRDAIGSRTFCRCATTNGARPLQGAPCAS